MGRRMPMGPPAGSPSVAGKSGRRQGRGGEGRRSRHRHKPDRPIASRQAPRPSSGAAMVCRPPPLDDRANRRLFQGQASGGAFRPVLGSVSMGAFPSGQPDTPITRWETTIVKGNWLVRGTSRRGAIGLAALGLVFVAGCGGTAGPGGGRSPGGTGASGSGPRLMFITNSNSDWWTAVEKGMMDGAEKFGARVELRRNEGQPEGQISKLEDALSQPDIKGVAVSVLEAESPGIADKMRELMKAGKVVITIDSDGQADARQAYIGTNNRKAGEVAGKAAAVLRPDGGKVAVFVGTASAANAIERREGFFSGAGPKFVQVEVFEDGSDRSGRAQSNVQSAISKYPDLGVFLGLWSYNAPRIAEEVGKSPELRKKSTVVTFDL